MSTGVIIALIVVVAVVVIVAAALSLRARRGHGGGSLKRRFGPEYDRAVARHDGDAKAAEQELAERVERHGSLRERELEPAQREQFEARWTAAQERFVDSPAEAVAEADRLLSEVAGARGFPDGSRHEEQLDALSVHHAHHVHGFRRVHRVVHAPVNGAGVGGGQAGTEEMREAMVEARALFEELVGPVRHRDHAESRDGAGESARSDGRGHLPWAAHKHHAKGS